MARDAPPTTPSNLVAFPSLSSSLSNLPQATSLQNVALHPNMYAQRAAESHAKLQKALSKTASSCPPQQPSTAPYTLQQQPAHSASSSPQLMMRPISSRDSVEPPPVFISHSIASHRTTSARRSLP
ncbi:hypothetical protein BD779DRAFT_1473749 [Infundibulicybe gibba]|nr:hypothetical protein BD779DRAFT_1473749 [Infundibulicybe gibba]